MIAHLECEYLNLLVPRHILTSDLTYSTLYMDGFWSHGIGNEGAIRIEEEGA
jgi:hypothetical protein